MFSKYSIIPMLLTLFANPAICGDATPASPPSVALELKVAEIALPQDGLVVGELVFLNIGQKPVALGANYVELTTHTGALLYELETPSGDRVEIRGWSGGDRVTFQYAQLNPGEWMGTPVFLLKRDGEFLFSELGDYRMRAIVGRYGEIWSSNTELQSNWVEFRVTKPGQGHDEWKKLAQGRDYYRVFSHYKLAHEGMWQLDEFGDYQREVLKLAVFQLHGKELIAALKSPKGRSENSLLLAEEVWALSRKRGVGENLWKWIIIRLQEEVDNPWRYSAVSNGYLFGS